MGDARNLEDEEADEKEDEDKPAAEKLGKAAEREVVVVEGGSERWIGSQQVESSGRSGSLGSFLKRGGVINGEVNLNF